MVHDQIDTENILQDKLASGYENVRYKKSYTLAWHAFLYAKILGMLNLAPHEKVLDNGCGVGMIEETCGLSNSFGCDLSLNMLKMAQKRIKRIVRCDSQCLAFKAGAFNKAFTIGVLHHLPQPEKGVAEMARVLKQNGQIVIAETNRTLLSTLPRKILYRNENHFHENHKNLSKKELCCVLEKYFRIDKVEYIGYLGSPLIAMPDVIDFGKYIPFLSKLAGWLIKLDNLISKIPGLNTQSWGIIILATKK